MPRRGSEKTICEGCGKKKAGGGMRFCYGCYGIILDNRGPTPQPRESSITYPLPKRKPRD